MAYDARQIANWFITRAKQDGRTLSIMSLLKLTYIAHGWHLETQGEPLISNKIEAWPYGPVIPDVYKEFRKQGVDVADISQTWTNGTFEQTDEFLLKEIWRIYGGLSPFHLSDLTHMTGGPWDLATKIGGNGTPIPNELILQHYQLLRARAQKSAENA